MRVEEKGEKEETSVFLTWKEKNSHSKRLVVSSRKYPPKKGKGEGGKKKGREGVKRTEDEGMTSPFSFLSSIKYIHRMQHRGYLGADAISYWWLADGRKRGEKRGGRGDFPAIESIIINLVMEYLLPMYFYWKGHWCQ